MEVQNHGQTRHAALGGFHLLERANLFEENTPDHCANHFLTNSNTRLMTRCSRRCRRTVTISPERMWGAIFACVSFSISISSTRTKEPASASPNADAISSG